MEASRYWELVEARRSWDVYWLSRRSRGSDVEDLYSEVVLECFARRGEVRDEGRFGWWLRKSLYRRMCDRYRKERRRRWLLERSVLREVSDDGGMEAVECRELLGHLGERGRVLVERHFYGGESWESIARERGVAGYEVRRETVVLMRRLRELAG